jgi:LCP family protein required for cell wall assembly
MAPELPASVPRKSRGRVAIPAVASFLWPGTGHWMLGARWLGLLLALPQLALVVALVIGLANGAAAFLGWMVDPVVLIGLIAFNLVLLLSRAYAIAGSAARASRGAPSRLSVLLVLALVVVSVVLHGQATRISWAAYDTITTVFDPSGPTGAGFGGDTASPSPSPSPTPWVGAGTPPPPEVIPTQQPVPPPDWPADGRLNLLLVGADSGPGRWKLRTDTMIVLSVEVSTGKAALIGVPRNIRYAPLPPPLDARYPYGYTDLLNALWVEVDSRPGSYPGDPAVAPFLALQDTIGLLLGVPIDASVVVDLNGFVRAVDALGGLDITVPEAVHDRAYPPPDGSAPVELFIGAGPQHLDGWYALAYARTRHQDSDYDRMARQQSVIVALQSQLRCGLAFRITELLDIARDSVWTNLPLQGITALVGLAGKVDPDAVARLTLTPPRFSPVLSDAGLASIRAAVSELLAAPAPSPAPSTEPTPGC